MNISKKSLKTLEKRVIVIRYPKMLYLNTVKAVATGHYERTNNMASNWEPETFSEKGPINSEITQ
jgi:hypothetical protein